jgi:hypothetical protein
MSSPFRRHKQRVQAIRAGAAPSVDSTAPAEPDTSTPEGKEYAALRVLLHDNLRALKDIASHEARIPKKRNLPAPSKPGSRRPRGGRSGQGRPGRNPGHQYALGDRLSRFRLCPGAGRACDPLPSGAARLHPHRRMRRGEEIAGIALAQAEAVPHEALLRTLELVNGADMPDPVMAKLYKAIGRSFARKADDFDPAADNAPAGGKAAYIEAALNMLSRALVLDRNIGVKKDLERLERQRKTMAEQATAT